MKSKPILALFWALLITISSLSAYAQNSKQSYETMRLIRQEKMDLVLPGAMRDNNVDMWIHVVQSANKDPLALDQVDGLNTAPGTPSDPTYSQTEAVTGSKESSWEARTRRGAMTFPGPARTCSAS